MPVITQTAVPSVTGEGDDMFCLRMSWSPPPSFCFQRTVAAVAVERPQVQAAGLGDVEEDVSPQTIGVAPLRIGSGVFQATFSVGDHFAGRPFSGLAPSSCGPRHCGQLSAYTESPELAASSTPSAIVARIGHPLRRVGPAKGGQRTMNAFYATVPRHGRLGLPILLDRDAESDDVLLPKMRAYDTTRELRHDMVTSDEYHEKNRDFAHSNERNLVIKEIAAGLRLWIDLSDHAIGINILRGRYELNELDFIRRTVRPGQHVVDCGAHIGYFAMHLAAAVGPAGSVSAFEPFEPNAECLERSIRENRFQDRVRLERAAVGAAPARCRWSTLPIRSTAAAHFFRDRATSPWDTRPARSQWLRWTAWRCGARSASSRPTSRGPSRSRFAGPRRCSGPTGRRSSRNCTRCSSSASPVSRPPSSSPRWAQGATAAICSAPACAGQEIDDAPNNGVTSVVFLPLVDGR